MGRNNLLKSKGDLSWLLIDLTGPDPLAIKIAMPRLLLAASMRAKPIRSDKECRLPEGGTL
jgi:hypothetical protein